MFVLLMAASTWASSTDVVENATRLAKSGDAEQAFLLLEQYIASEPDGASKHSAVLSMVGLANRDRRAIAAFLDRAPRVLDRVEPEDRAYLTFHMGTRYAALQNFEASDAVLAKGIKDLPPSRWTWSMRYQIGLNRCRQGSYEEAVTELTALEQEATTVPEDFRILQLQLISATHGAMRWKETIRRAEAVVPHMQDGQQKLLVLDQLADSYYRSSDYGSAVRAYTSYLELHKKLYPQPDELQSLQRQTVEGNLDTARRLLSESPGAIPENKDASVERGTR